MVEKYKNAIKSLWKGRCTVSILEDYENEDNGRTLQRDKTLFADVPCRLSFDKVESTVEVEHASRKGQNVTLIIGSEYKIPEGSKITVTQLGVTREYERSGTPAVYSIHQEVPLVLKKEWA